MSYVSGFMMGAAIGKSIRQMVAGLLMFLVKHLKSWRLLQETLFLKGY